MNYLQLYHGLGGDIIEAGSKAVGQWAEVVKANAKMKCPGREHTNLRNSIHSYVRKTEEGINAKIYTNCEYAAPVEFGSGPKGRGTYPYSIKGYNPNYKADKWRVKIPDVGVRWISGQVAQPFMSTAYFEEKNNHRGEKRAIRVMQDEIRKLGGIK